MSFHGATDQDIEEKHQHHNGGLSSDTAKKASEDLPVEHVEESQNLAYDDPDEEPELHARTYVALLAMLILNFVQLAALLAPSALLSYIGASVNGTVDETWIANALTLGQAVLGPVISAASDTFQARKSILVASCAFAFVGSAIAPGSSNVYRVIASSALIGIAFAAAPLSYSIPSEIVPRRWRPMVQGAMNCAACLGAFVGPLIIGGFTRKNELDGWRNFYWTMMGLWGASAVGIIVGYKPPKRHTRFDHLSVWQKLGHVDIIGSILITAGLTLFLVGLNLGGGLYSWKNVRTLATLVIGLAVLIVFALYEWKGTKTGILHHDLFRGADTLGRTFALCLLLIFIEAILAFAFVVFYPTLTSTLFEQNPLLLTVRLMPFWVATALSTIVWGYASSKFKTIAQPLFVGFLIATGGVIGLTTIQPSDSTKALVFAGLVGVGYGAPLILVLAGVQLSTPHRLIASATAVTISTRAVAASVFTAIFSAAFRTRLDKDLPSYVAKAALGAGLPTQALPAFIEALATNDVSALSTINGVTPAIVASGITALKQAYADSLRVVFIIAAPFGIVACIACLFLGSLRKTMNYRVDAPVENLHARRTNRDGIHTA